MDEPTRQLLRDLSRWCNLVFKESGGVCVGAETLGYAFSAVASGCKASHDALDVVKQVTESIRSNHVLSDHPIPYAVLYLIAEGALSPDQRREMRVPAALFLAAAINLIDAVKNYHHYGNPVGSFPAYSRNYVSPFPESAWPCTSDKATAVGFECADMVSCGEFHGFIDYLHWRKRVCFLVWSSDGSSLLPRVFTLDRGVMKDVDEQSLCELA